jgi:hypothetical protein
MPLPHYGVAIGRLVSFTRDPRHDFGSWYHGHVTLATAAGTWESALDVDAPQAVGVSYRVVRGLGVADLGRVAALPEGFHALTHDPGSGALDYQRSPALQDRPLVRLLRRVEPRRSAAGWTPPPPGIGEPGGPDPRAYLPAPFGPGPVDRLLQRVRRGHPWISSNGDNALDALSPHLNAAQLIYLFGERYEHGGNGVHDVHMNQGDAAGTQWYDSDGAWQDGAVACRRPSGEVVIWQVRFNAQRLPTDDRGHPV